MEGGEGMDSYSVPEEGRGREREEELPRREMEEGGRGLRALV